MATRHLSGRDLVTRVFSPRVAIVASQGATELCQANHLPSVVDLFKPFGDRIDGRVMVHGSQGLPTAIDNLFLRFADIEQLDEPDQKARERWVAEVVRAKASLESGQHTIQSREDVTLEYLNMPADQQFPWYTEYCNLLLSTGGISDHETFDHPVACIIAISSLSTDPINEIHYLTNSSTPQAAFDKGFMDPTTLKYYVLLHDCRNGDLTSAMDLLEKMRRTFGLHCGILKINSADPDAQNRARNAHIWTKSVAHSMLLSLGRSSGDSSLMSSSGGRDSVSSVTSGTGSIVGTSGTLSDLTLQRSSMSSPVYAGTGNSSPTFAQNQVYAYLGSEDDGSNNNNNSTRGSNANLLDIPVSKNVDLALDLLLHPERSAEPYGCCMSDEDIAGIPTFLRDMVAQSIVPYMERNINHWNEQVAVSRRGIAGRFRRYFGSGSKPAGSVIQQPATSTSGGGIIYHHSSPEAHMRKLADWAFMLRDYKFAASTYDSVKKDFSSDKAWKYYGGTQEMIGLCTLMSGQSLGSKIEVDYYLESAVNSYVHKARSPYFACRATILYYELLKQKRMYKESPVSLTRMTAEASDLSNGILLEQAAFCYLKSSSRPQIRKFAFHMVMAGHRFYKAGQTEHAYRCYKTASDVYASKGWGLIDTHVSCALGRQMYQMGKPEEALEHYAKLLTESKQSAQQQGIYMKEFLNVYRDYTNKIESDPLRETFPDFPLPVVLGQTARVVVSTSEPTNDNNGPWLELVGETQKSTGVAAGDERVVSAVGEHVLVTLDIKNPLQVPLILTDIILGCEHSTSTTSFTVPVDAAEEAHMVLYEQQNPTFSGRVVYTAFDIDRIDRLIMEPGQTRTLQFEVLPKQEGQIRVMGLHCNVEGQVHAYKDIVKRGKRLNQTKDQMMSKVYAEDRSLNIIVAPHMPLLDVVFHQTPEMMLSGEVCQLMLEVKNLGKKGLKNLNVRLSHPGFFCMGAEKDGELGLYKSGNGASGRETIHVDNSLQDLKSWTIPLQNGVLNPDESAVIPVWLRGDKIGRHQFLFLFTYESEQTGTAMRSRTLRHAIATQVLPSLKINAFTRPSTKGLNEFILGIETENLQTVAEFEFLQISSLSPGWIIEPVDKAGDSEDNKLITPRQTVYTYYRIRKDPALVPPAVSPEVFMAKALEKLVLGQERLKDTPPPVDLQVCHLSTREAHIQMSTPVLRHLSQASRLGWRHGALAAQFSMIPSTVDRKHLFSVYGTNDIDLALFWNIPKLNRRGHHYIIGINLGVQQNPYQPMPTAVNNYGTGVGNGDDDDDDDDDDEEKVAARRALYDQTMREQVALVNALTNNPHFRDESPVKIALRSADVVEHGSFDTRKLCHTPVRVLVKNCSWNKHIAFTLEMLSSEDPMVPQRATAATAPGGGPLSVSNSNTTNPHVNAHPFYWSGPTVTTSYLEPLQETEVVVLACFTAFGVYDINRWRLSVQVVKPMRRKKKKSGGNGGPSKTGIVVDEDEQDLQPPALPQSIGKGFMQMPNLAHYIQVS